MSPDSQVGDGAVGREYGRLLLVACCVLAIVLSAAVAPLFSAGGVAGLLAEGGLGNPPEAPGGDIPGPPGSFGGGAAPADRPSSDDYGGTSGGLDYPASSAVGGTPTLSDRVELYLDAPGATYLREGAYGTYTGSGWNRSTDRRAYDGPLADTDRLPADRRVVQTVTLARATSVLPAVWRPVALRLDGPPAFVTDQRSFVTERALPAGATYQVASYRPARDPATLRSAGRDYPAAVEQRYTRLPASTPDRVARFTDRVTAGADSPYETAVAVREWLQANKAYALNVSHDRGRDVAAQFLFEMDAGYCQYFATTMAVMLRTQGVPARYVTGYGPSGERAANGSYVYRGRNAHAWVEVYFPDVGWVRFDPTPASGRYRAGRTAQAPPGAAARPLNVSVSPPPVPGRRVTVTVRRGEYPVPGATVRFNGDPVGTTDVRGQLRARVPYVERLAVTATAPATVNASTGGAPAPGAAAAGGAGVVAASSAGAPAATAGNDTAERTYALATNATIEVSGTPRPGETVTVLASVDGEPVRGGEVTVDGTVVGRTDAAGTLAVSLPTSGPVDIAVRKGAVRGATTVALVPGGTTPSDPAPADRGSTLTVSVAPRLPLTLPGTAVTVTTTRAGAPVPNATVRVADRRVGTTGPNGTLVATLPFAGVATVTAAAGGEVATTRVGNLYLHLAGALVLALAALGALVQGVRRVGAPDATGLVALAGAVRNGGRLLLVALVALTRRLDALGDRLLAAAGRARAALRESGSPRELLAGALDALREGAERVLAADPLAAIAARSRRLRAVLDEGRPRGGDASSTPETGGAAGPSVSPLDVEGRSHRDVWLEFVRAVAARDWRTRTPGEVARRAIRREDLPREPVRTLLEGFRAAEYGDSPATDLEGMERALDAVRDATGEGGD
ncbi:MAG: DUF3488 and DUF4129 domain-containing transglutaminase family protein [Halorientalis sp.]